MQDYVFTFDGRADQRRRASFDTLRDARNDAVRSLGAYLAEHPEYASEGHWRVDVENASGKVLLHVIVATVNAHDPLAATE